MLLPDRFCNAPSLEMPVPLSVRASPATAIPPCNCRAAPLTTIVPVDLFGLASFGVIFAGLNLVSTTGEAMGAPVAGFIFDATGSYRIAFIICIAIDTIATILAVAIWREGKRKEKVVANKS